MNVLLLASLLQSTILYNLAHSCTLLNYHNQNIINIFPRDLNTISAQAVASDETLIHQVLARAENVFLRGFWNKYGEFEVNISCRQVPRASNCLHHVGRLSARVRLQLNVDFNGLNYS